MSYYTGYEIVIASDNESTLQQVLKDLRDNFPRFYYDGGLKKLGDNSSTSQEKTLNIWSIHESANRLVS